MDDRLDRCLFGVGKVDADGVRFWLRPTKPGRYRIAIHEVDTGQCTAAVAPFEVLNQHDLTASVWCPLGNDGGVLTPGQPCLARLLTADAGEELAVCRFEGYPQDAAGSPDQFGFAFASCHQPFNDGGELNEKSLRMLKAWARLVSDEHIKGILLLGDQMYADLPEGQSLFDETHFQRVAPPGRESVLQCTREEVRELYQARYRAFWRVPGWAEVMASAPCFMIFDDHEFVDNFGAAPEHHGPGFRALREGALDAGFDYQGLWRHARAEDRPAALHTSFAYGPMAAFLMDLRSEKWADESEVRMCSFEQLAELSQFLQEQRGRELVVLGLSVPLVHYPEWLMTFGERTFGKDSDAADRWSHERARGFRDRFLKILLSHQRACPKQRLVLLGGDVHSGVVTELTWEKFGLRMVQCVSSAVSNLEHLFKRRAAALAPRLSAGMSIGDGELKLRSRLLEGVGSAKQNPIGDLNVGVLSFTREDEGWCMRAKLFTHDEGATPQPVLVYESGAL